MDECMTALDFSTWIMESCQLFCQFGQWRRSYPLLDGIVTGNIFRQIGILLHLTRQMEFPLHSALFSKCQVNFLRKAMSRNLFLINCMFLFMFGLQLFSYQTSFYIEKCSIGITITAKKSLLLYCSNK